MVFLCMIASEDNPPPIRRSAASGGVMTAIQSTPSSQPYDSGGSFLRRARQGFKKAVRSTKNCQQFVWGQDPVIFSYIIVTQSF
jgi:hypothetical protein